MMDARRLLVGFLAGAVTVGLASCVPGQDQEPSWADRVTTLERELETVDFQARGAVELDCQGSAGGDQPSGTGAKDGIHHFCWQWESADPVSLIDEVTFAIHDAWPESAWMSSGCASTGWRELAFIPSMCKGFVLDGAYPGSYAMVTAIPYYEETDFFETLREARERDGYISAETMELLPEPRVVLIIAYIDPALRPSI